MASCEGLGIWLGCLEDEIADARPAGRSPGGQCTTGWMDYPTWNTSGAFVGAWMYWSGWWRSEYPTQPVGTAGLVLGSKKMMYGWMSSWMDLWKHGNKLLVLSISFTKCSLYIVFFGIVTAFDRFVYLWKPIMHWFFSPLCFLHLKNQKTISQLAPAQGFNPSMSTHTHLHQSVKRDCGFYFHITLLTFSILLSHTSIIRLTLTFLLETISHTEDTER